MAQSRGQFLGHPEVGRLEAQAEFRLALFAVSFWQYVSKREELSTPVQVRGIGCLAWYADSWGGESRF